MKIDDLIKKIKSYFEFIKKEHISPYEYLGILLKEKDGIVYIIKKEQDKTSIIAKEKFIYTNNWDNLSEDIDEVLYRFELKGLKSPEKSIFFIYSNLLDNLKKEIKKEYLLKIKSVVKNLELKPMGYIEVHDGVLDFLNIKEGIPLSSILIEINNNIVSVFLYKNGKKLFVDEVQKSENITECLIPVFEKFKSDELLPSRIIVYDSKNIEREVSDILSYSWDKSIFMHHPKVDIINEEDLTNSLIEIFQRQLTDKEAAPVPSQPIEQKKVMGFIIGGENKNNFQIKENKYFLLFKKNLNALLEKIKQIKLTRNTAFLIGGLLIIVSLILLEKLFHKSEVIVTLPSQTIKKTLVIDSIDPDISSKSATFTATKKTTGTKEVGEKARGEVTIHNFSSSEVQFESGAILTTSNLSFVLDSDTKVASASLTADASAKLPGKTKAKITANIIGGDHNISSNNRFKLEDLPETDYFAINENAISGGSKKEVKNVSESDIQSLENNVNKQAENYRKNKADQDFMKKNTLVDQLGGIDFETLKYDKKIGDEATSLTLNSKARITYVGLNNEKVNKIILEELKKEIKKNYLIKKDNIKYKVTEVDETRNEYIFDIDVTVKASEDIRSIDIKKLIVGKSQNNIKEVLENKYDILTIESNIISPFSIIKKTYPIFKNNIDLKIIYK